MSDIVKAAGVAQGTFYWHFTSKGEVLDAVVRAMADEVCAEVSAIARDPGQRAYEKMGRMWDMWFGDAAEKSPLMVDFHGERSLLADFHQEDNRRFHDRLAQEVIESLGPLVGEVIAQGVAEGDFETAYPREAASFILAACRTVFDDLARGRKEAAGHRIESLWDFVLKGVGCRRPVLPPGPT